MHSSLRSAVPLAVAVPLFSLGLLTVPASADEVEQLTVVERASTDAVTDTGAAGDSAGDVLTFVNEVYDQANKTLVGHDNGWCVRTVAGSAWECFWTLTLNDGQITVEGPFYDGKDSMLAVTGGTGAYTGAHGEMKLHARDAAGSAYDFVYSLRR
jgi:allene oxide cyclase